MHGLQIRAIGLPSVRKNIQGTSVAFDNNPIYWADPSGADAEWIGDYGPSRPNSVTIAYQQNSKVEDRHTVIHVEVTKGKDSFSEDGNTKTTTSYTSTTREIYIRNKKTGSSSSTMQTVDKTTETYTKDSKGNWVSNKDRSTSNLATNTKGLVHEAGASNGNVTSNEYGITNDGNFISTSRSSTNNTYNKRVQEYLLDSNVGDNLIDDTSAFKMLKSGSKVAGYAIGVLGVIKKVPTTVAKKAGLLGLVITGYDYIDGKMKTAPKSKELLRY